MGESGADAAALMGFTVLFMVVICMVGGGVCWALRRLGLMEDSDRMDGWADTPGGRNDRLRVLEDQAG